MSELQWKYEDGVLLVPIGEDPFWVSATPMLVNRIIAKTVRATQEKCAQVADERAKRCRAYALEVWDDTLRQRETVAAAECMSVASAIRSLKLTEPGNDAE